MGKHVGFHLPTTLRVLEVGGTEGLFEVMDYGIPSTEALLHHYQIANPSSLVPMMVPMDDWVSCGAGHDLATICPVAFVPQAWAPYFMQEMLPWQGLQEITALMASLQSEVHQKEFLPLQLWA